MFSRLWRSCSNTANGKIWFTVVSSLLIWRGFLRQHFCTLTQLVIQDNQTETSEFSSLPEADLVLRRDRTETLVSSKHDIYFQHQRHRFWKLWSNSDCWSRTTPCCANSASSCCSASASRSSRPESPPGGEALSGHQCTSNLFMW